MRRNEFEHVIAAAAEVCGEAELVVVGSQAILGPFPDAPDSMLRSMEADLYPRVHPEKADDIDGSLGDGSWFHRSYGYYAHGVGPETAKAPAGWEERLIAVEIRLLHDAVRERDLVAQRRAEAVAGAALDLGADDIGVDGDAAIDGGDDPVVEEKVLLSREEDLPVDQEHRRHVREMLEAIPGA